VPTAPTLVSHNTVPYNSTALTLTSPSISWNANDVIVVVGGTEGANSSDILGTPTATGLTFTARQTIAPSTRCAAYVWTAVAGSSGSGTISVVHNNTSDAGFTVWVFRGSAGVGNSAQSSTSSLTTSLTPTAAHSAIVWGVFDWNAGSLQTITPTPTNTEARVQYASLYTVYVAELTDQVSAGAVSYGISGSGSGPFSIVVLEIKGSASGTQYSQTINATTASFAGAVTKQTNKLLTSTESSFSGLLNKRTAKTLTSTQAAFSGQVTKQTTRTLTASMSSFAGTVSGAVVFVKNLTASMGNFAGAITKQINKQLLSSMSSFAGTISKKTSHILQASLANFSGSLSKKTSISLNASMNTFSATLKETAVLFQSLNASMSSFAGTLSSTLRHGTQTIQAVYNQTISQLVSLIHGLSRL